MHDLSAVPKFEPISFQRPDTPTSIVNAMADYQAMLDLVREGKVNAKKAGCPDDHQERANHLKAFGYFCDASMVGIARMQDEIHLEAPLHNPGIDTIADILTNRETKTFASGLDAVLADLREALAMTPTSIDTHTHSIVFLYEYPRDPKPGETGCDWIEDAQRQRACLRSTETAVVIAGYLRLLGYEARAHSGAACDVDLNRLTIAAGLATVEGGVLTNPYIGTRFGVAAVTTDFALSPDRPLVAQADQPRGKTHGLAWRTGYGFAKNAANREPYGNRRFVDGAYPFETLKRVENPTTFIDEMRVPRVPKRTDMFARSLFGDMGPKTQASSKGGHFIRKSVTAMAQRAPMGALTMLQGGPSAPTKTPIDPQTAAHAIKATAYFLGADAVGISRCPDWTWYSHNAEGTPIDPPHDQAISMVIDQGYDTMEGASGDDWIAVAQSMRAYLRFCVLGGVIAQQIRNLGYGAKAHTVTDGEVLQPPLLLLAGLGEVSRIGEVILNPFLGPRLKSGVITTDLPLTHDKPIDFGMQKFCEACNKCARECPSGAITAGPKRMFNGYEIWKSDSQKCTTYRLTTPGGAMCGRCMKTCPWNLEGLFAEAPFRWAAMNIPQTARILAKLDDVVGHGELNPAKKWWWDLEIQDDGAYKTTDKPVNQRALQKDLDLKPEDQTLAVYPAHLAPHPHPYPYPMDREKGIQAYKAMISVEEYKMRLARGDEQPTEHVYTNDGESPVLGVIIAAVDKMANGVTRYEFRASDGRDLPEWSAGAHIDIVVAPEYLRQYSLCGDPADRSKYEIGVLREEHGRGGSDLLHRIFNEGRKIFISRPINHFELVESAKKTFLMGGGIGVTPMIAFAHRLHRVGADFELHYSAKSKSDAGFISDLTRCAWADHVHLHFSDDGSRADLDTILAHYQPGWHVYTCGPDRYMDAVMAAAKNHHFPDAACHLEYFSVPATPDYINHPFTLKLEQSNREIPVKANQSAAQALIAAGYSIDMKCSDGICGVCQCGLIDGDVEHRDYVLSNSQRENKIILCQSRANKPGGVVTIDL